MDRLIKITKDKVKRQLENLSVDIIDITQEDDMVIGWYNLPNGSTRTVVSYVPFWNILKEFDK